MRKKWQGFLRKAYRAVKKLSEVLLAGIKHYIEKLLAVRVEDFSMVRVPSQHRDNAILAAGLV